MVASGNPVYLNAKTGAVTGTATAAGGSLVGAGDQVGNALLKGSAIVTAQPTTPTTTTPTTATTTATGPSAGATTTNSTGASQTPTDTGTGGAGQAPQTPGLLPSPTTH
jgi:hypothetical protein